MEKYSKVNLKMKLTILFKLNLLKSSQNNTVKKLDQLIVLLYSKCLCVFEFIC